MLDISRLLTVIPDDCDARVEFVRLATWCGWGPVDEAALEVTGRSPVDQAAARAAGHFGGEIKSVLWASFDGHGVEAFAGPALVPLANALIDAADDVHRVHVSGTYRAECANAACVGNALAAQPVKAPATEWLLRARFPGVAPHDDATSALFARLGLQTIAATTNGDAHWRRITATTRTRVEAAITELHRRHRVTLAAIRAL